MSNFQIDATPPSAELLRKYSIVREILNKALSITGCLGGVGWELKISFHTTYCTRS